MSKSIKLKDNTYIDSSSITHNRQTLKSMLNRTKYIVLYDTIKTPSLVTLRDNVQNYDFIIVKMTSNYYDHYQYLNILSYDLSGLYSWRNQRLAYFSGEGNLVCSGYCNIYDNKFDGRNLTLDDYIHITSIIGVKLI